MQRSYLSCSSKRSKVASRGAFSHSFGGGVVRGRMGFVGPAPGNAAGVSTSSDER
jgi:hypothetical protein